ncbi:hypothetical protein AVEN_261412-1 [Araneus ventricosus]|uniref:Uncharacterized protein n=1 Tax=Araneus ventricosus TaxID=182803 RepID=A0A4Y2VRZ4_ARAVE|nr:hypothetical protein AVEN_261412-1 [Araneus ventricosus]
MITPLSQFIKKQSPTSFARVVGRQLSTKFNGCRAYGFKVSTSTFCPTFASAGQPGSRFEYRLRNIARWLGEIVNDAGDDPHVSFVIRVAPPCRLHHSQTSLQLLVAGQPLSELNGGAGNDPGTDVKRDVIIRVTPPNDVFTSKLPTR